MMSPETIRHLARKQARTAARNGSKPLIFEAEDLPRVAELARHIPNIGSYRPRGYVLLNSFLVDKSGFGAEGEPALTFAGFCRRIKAGMAYAIIEEGQFQVVVGEFEVKRAVRIDPALRHPLNRLHFADGSSAAECAHPDCPSAPPVIRILRQADLLKCPFAILAPEHYRDDGSCRCDDAAHREVMIKSWGYRRRDFAKIPLRA